MFRLGPFYDDEWSVDILIISPFLPFPYLLFFTPSLFEPGFHPFLRCFVAFQATSSLSRAKSLDVLL